MKKDYTRFLKAFYPILFLASLTSTLIFTYGIFYDKWAFFGFVPSLLLIPVSVVLDHWNNKGFKVKFIFAKKEFNKQLQASLEKFGTTDETFVSEFTKTAKRLFKKTGKIFYEENNDWIFQSEICLAQIPNIFQVLSDCIKSKKGFPELIDKFESFDLDEYEFLAIFETDMVPNELGYLMNQVYTFTSFNLKNTGLSDSYTKEIDEKIKTLNDVYNPMLFRFEKDIENVLKKVKNKKK